MDLLSFERKLDSTIMRKRLDIQEALKRPMKQKRKLRIFISNTAFPAKDPAAEAAAAAANASGDGGTPVPPPPATGEQQQTTASWELRVEGRVIDDDKKVDPSKMKRKFSSFFKSLVIELDKVRQHGLMFIISTPWSPYRSCMVLTTTWLSGIVRQPRKRQTDSR